MVFLLKITLLYVICLFIYPSVETHETAVAKFQVVHDTVLILKLTQDYVPHEGSKHYIILLNGKKLKCGVHFLKIRSSGSNLEVKGV